MLKCSNRPSGRLENLFGEGKQKFYLSQQISGVGKIKFGIRKIFTGKGKQTFIIVQQPSVLGKISFGQGKKSFGIAQNKFGLSKMLVGVGKKTSGVVRQLFREGKTLSSAGPTFAVAMFMMFVAFLGCGKAEKSACSCLIHQAVVLKI